MKRFLLFYLLPLLLFAVAGFVSVTQTTNPNGMVGFIGLIVLLVFGFYIGLGLIALAFYAKFFRVAIEGLSLAGLDFAFHARTKDWLMLFLGDIALVIGTLGIGSIFLQYRHWKFFATHMAATGEIHADALTQSQTKTARHGEGLLDAFDVGAF